MLLAPSSAVAGSRGAAGSWRRVYAQDCNAGTGTAEKLTYDLCFTTNENDFNFRGGGLVIRTTPVGAYLSDTSCEQVDMWGASTDASGLFVGQFYADADGLYDWTNNRWDAWRTNTVNIVKIICQVGFPRVRTHVARTHRTHRPPLPRARRSPRAT